MRVINGWVESIPRDHSLTSGFYLLEELIMVINGFYVLKDNFFELVNDPFLKDNKHGNRPFYYCLKEEDSLTEMYWMIPLSSKIEKYSHIITEKELRNKPTDGLYICELPNNRKSVFLIQDMFPVLERFVERDYTLGSNHLLLVKEHDISTINKKAKRVIKLIKRGIKLTPTSPDVLKIISLLKKVDEDLKTIEAEIMEGVDDVDNGRVVDVESLLKEIKDKYRF